MSNEKREIIQIFMCHFVVFIEGDELIEIRGVITDTLQNNNPKPICYDCIYRIK